MDLSTVGLRLEAGDYETMDEFEADVRLIFRNCYLFNPPGSPVFNSGTQLEAAFNMKWAEKHSFLSQHGESRPRNKTSYDGDSSDDYDEEDGNLI
jgi:bromodomain-containing factor 1